MAKSPVEITHRFRLHAETSVEDMGPLLMKLTLMGLQNIGFEVIEDVSSYKAKVKHENSAEEAMAEWINENPTFKINDACKHFEAIGRSRAAIYHAASVLVKKKVLRKLDAGNYTATHVKALPAPKGKREKEPTRKFTTPYEIPNRTILWNAIKNRKTFTLAMLREVFEKDGRPQKSVSPIITKMVTDKQIKHTGPGEYEVLKTKTKAKAKTKRQPPLAPAPNLNGAGVVDHG